MQLNIEQCRKNTEDIKNNTVNNFDETRKPI